MLEELTVFTHLSDMDGNTVGQHDGPPLLGLYPTDRWVPGIVVPDPHPIALGEDLESGDYHLSVGMYRHPSLERVRALRPDGTPWADDIIEVTQVLVVAPQMEPP